MEHTATQSPSPGRSAPGSTWNAYLADLLRAPARAKAALVGCFILMTLSPAGLSAMMPFITAAFSARTGKPMPEAILLFVALPLLISPLILPIAGAWVDRQGARKVAIPSTLVYALLTGLVPICSAMPGLQALVIVLAAVFGFMASLAVVFKVINAWFPHHRGIGFALIGTVSSLASALLSPVFLWLVGDGRTPGSGLGWDGTYYAVAATIAAVAIPASVFLISEPAFRATAPSTPKVPALTQVGHIPGFGIGEAIRTRAWLFVAISLALAAAGPMAVRQNAMGFFAERGFDPATIALSQSVLFMASIVGLLSGGMIMDRTRRPWIVVPIFAAVPVGLALCYLNHGNLPLLFLGTGCLGFATGAESSLGPFLIARYFGPKCFAQLQGLTLTISTLTLGLSPFLVSAMQVATGSYAIPFAVLTGATALAALLALFLPKYPPEWPHPAEQDGLPAP